MTAYSRLMLGPLLVVAVSAAGPQPPVVFPPLPAATSADWSRYVAAVGERMDRELKSTAGYLALDFGGSAAADRKSVLSGSTSIVQMAARDAKGRELDVRDGWVHDWRGAILLPGIKLERLFQRLQMEVPGAGKGDVLEGYIRGRRQDAPIITTFMKIRREYYFTFVYNTEHEVEFRKRDALHGSSRSVATRIAQVAEAGTRSEHDYAAGQDDGYLLRWNSYWRYEEVPQGVIAECESVSLSNPAPALMGPLARMISRSAARESMERALQSLKEFAATRLGTRPVLSQAR